MSDNDQNQQDNTPAPKTAAALLSQIDAQLAKKDTESVKAKATEIKGKIREHERSIRLLTAELEDLLGKFEKGLL